MLMQHFLGTKRANYYAYTCRQWTAQQALDWGWVNELCPKGKVVERAWEIARMIKSLPRETRTIMSHLCKRPLEKLLVDDLKIHTLSEQYSTIYRIAQKDYGEAQVDEKDMSAVHHYRYTRGENEWLQQPIRSWDDIRNDVPKWAKEHGFVEADERFAEDEDK